MYKVATHKRLLGAVLWIKLTLWLMLLSKKMSNDEIINVSNTKTCSEITISPKVTLYRISGFILSSQSAAQIWHHISFSPTRFFLFFSKIVINLVSNISALKFITVQGEYCINGSITPLMCVIYWINVMWLYTHAEYCVIEARWDNCCWCYLKNLISWIE